MEGGREVTVSSSGVRSIMWTKVALHDYGGVAVMKPIYEYDIDTYLKILYNTVVLFWYKSNYMLLSGAFRSVTRAIAWG